MSFFCPLVILLVTNELKFTWHFSYPICYFSD
jgi:hypothetical protein